MTAGAQVDQHLLAVAPYLNSFSTQCMKMLAAKLHSLSYQKYEKASV